MPTVGEDPPTWEVLRSSSMRDEVDRYRPPPLGKPDPLTLVGRPDKLIRRIGMPLWVASTCAPFVGVVVSWMPAAFRVLTVAGVVASVLVAVLVVATTRRAWKAPEVTVNGEQLTASDVAGVTRTVAWSDVTRLVLSSASAGFTEEVHLTWLSADGAGVTMNLGNTLGMHDLAQAFGTRLPEGAALEVVPRAIKRRW